MTSTIRRTRPGAALRNYRAPPALPRLLVASQYTFNIGFFAVLPYLADHLAGLGLAGWLVGLVLGLRTFSQQGMFVVGGADAFRWACLRGAAVFLGVLVAHARLMPGRPASAPAGVTRLRDRWGTLLHAPAFLTLTAAYSCRWWSAGRCACPGQQR